MAITTELDEKIREACDIISLRAPDHAHEASQMRRALEVGSPIIAARFRTLIDNSFGSTMDRDRFTEDEKRLFGEIMVELAGGNPVADRVIRFRLTSDEQAVINACAARDGKSISQYIREAISHYESCAQK